jgi:lipopolysaccharide transport system ATP-binding protein
MSEEKVISLKNVGFSYSQRKKFRLTKKRVLKDVSFDIYRGETVGIIGKNGSGKSTILKLLAGIYEPDEGIINKYHNKVSLQTLSAGFDVELSGRDNALMGAMLLGHSKKSAQAKLKEIKSVSELNHDFNEPVKTYSSGMRARLGFATAITMETDVLLIDEVLGVGDSAFRIKAESIIINKTKSNMTVIIVSHASEEIERLCNRVIYINQGSVQMIGDGQEVLEAYLQAPNDTQTS